MEVMGFKGSWERLFPGQIGILILEQPLHAFYKSDTGNEEGWSSPPLTPSPRWLPARVVKLSVLLCVRGTLRRASSLQGCARCQTQGNSRDPPLVTKPWDHVTFHGERSLQMCLA